MTVRWQRDIYSYRPSTFPLLYFVDSWCVIIFWKAISCQYKLSTDIFHLLTVCFYHVKNVLRVNLHSVIVWMSRNSLFQTSKISEGEVNATGIKPTTTCQMSIDVEFIIYHNFSQALFLYFLFSYSHTLIYLW